MTYMKPISGHSSAKWIRYYLFKNDRALDRDFLNLTDRDWQGRDWAKVMDRTREIWGNNVARKNSKVRTYEHIIISLDEKDNGVELEDFRDFVNEWASKWFDSRGPEGEGIGRFEVAIAYHDDNTAREAEGEQGILHAHLVINNTDLETKRRIAGLLTTKVIQAMRADLQTMSLERGWHAFATDGKSYTKTEMDAKRLQVSRGKRLDRAMSALDDVLADEAKGVQEEEDLGRAMADRMAERYSFEKIIPETFDPAAAERPTDASENGFSYTTMRTEDGRALRLVVPRGYGDSETMAERQIEEREGWSWKEDIRNRVDVALRVSAGSPSFSTALDELGVKVNYNRDGDLVFHHPSDPVARKVRGAKLGKEYTASAIESVLSNKHGARRQRAHNLPGRERWMTDEERRAAMAIARAATPCTREGAELMSKLVDAVNDIGPNAIDLATSLNISVPAPAPRRKKMTADEIIAATQDYRDEMGYGGNSLGSTVSSSSQPHQQGSEPGGEARTRGVSR